MRTIVQRMSDADDRDGELAQGTDRRRTIKRYSNRKLYDTRESRYVTLLEVADLIRAGEDIQVIDNATKADKTEVTLALIISEELKTQPRDIPLAALRGLIRERGGKLISQLREGPIGKLMPKDADTEPTPPTTRMDERAEDIQPRESVTKGLRATLEQWQAAIDERVRAIIPSPSSLAEIQQELVKLSARIDAIEAQLSSQPAQTGTPPTPSSDGPGITTNLGG